MTQAAPGRQPSPWSGGGLEPFPFGFVADLDKRRLLTIGTSGFRRQVGAGRGGERTGREAHGRPAACR